MIVKNESAIIERALNSVIPYIDSWVICDTGSTDGTQGIIEKTLKDIPGILCEVPWVNFGENRTESMNLARLNFGDADYLLVLDADYCLSVEPGFDWGSLTADAYDIHHQGENDFGQTLLFSARKPWRWVGVVHEHPICEGQTTTERVRGITIVDRGDGSNQRDDLTPLLAEHEAHPDDPRTIFYIAQTYLGLHQFEDALPWYTKRAEMEDFPEERWFALMQKARLMQQLGRDPQQVREAYIRAYFFRSHRYEPLCWLAQFCRLQGDYEAAFTFASLAGTDLRYPLFDHLFIFRPVYDYFMLFEYGMAAAITRRLTIAREAYLRLLETNAPQENKSALASAIQWAEDQAGSSYESR